MSFSNVQIDETIIDVAVKNDCSLFLEDAWLMDHDSNENAQRFYACNVGFISYVRVMIKYKKYEMAAEAIKNWILVWKEESLFDILLDYDLEELLM